jgi:hypothetical protein
MDVEDARAFLLDRVGRREREPRPAAERHQRDAEPEQDRRQRPRNPEEARGIGKGMQDGHAG